jgi:hypothetical protein
MTKILRLITLKQAREREGDRGRTSQHRDRTNDQDYPKPVYRNGRPYLVEHEHQEYLARLIARAREEQERERLQEERDRKREVGAGE